MQSANPPSQVNGNHQMSQDTEEPQEKHEQVTTANNGVEKQKSEPLFLAYSIPKKKFFNITEPPIERMKDVQEILHNIGKNGEICFFSKILPDLLLKEFPSGKIVETQQGFNVIHGDNILAQVIWNNKMGESRANHDFFVEKHEKSCFIEVKATTKSTKEFTISKNELNKAKIEGENYTLFLITDLNKEGEKAYSYPNFYVLYKQKIFKKKSITLTV